MIRWRRAQSAEDGFTLIEMVVAMTVAALILTGGAAVLGNSMKAIVAARANTQSAELMSEKIEKLRTLDYAAVAMVATDLTGDTNIGGTAIAPTFDPDGAGPLVAESVVTTIGGAVSPHIETVTRNDQSYTLATYVTTPPTDTEVSAAAYKRVTVRATWTSGGLTHTRQSSTFITLTRRGLPLPNFQLTATAGVESPIPVNATAQLELPFNVVNRGARDTFNLSISGSPSFGADFDFHYADDTAADDSDADGTPDTGELETDHTVSMVAVATVPSDATGGSYIFTLTATSAGQPTATGSTRTAQFDVTVLNDNACSECTYSTLNLFNQFPACATSCSTTIQTNMRMEPTAASAQSLSNFDTDVDTVVGRSLARGSTTPAWNSTTNLTMANWRYTVGNSGGMLLNGNLIVEIYVAQSGADPIDLIAYVNKSTNGSGATSYVAQGTASAPASATFQKVTIQVLLSNVTIPNNRFLEVKLVVNSSPTSLNGGHLAYDAPGYPSVVKIPVV